MHGVGVVIVERFDIILPALRENDVRGFEDFSELRFGEDVGELLLNLPSDDVGILILRGNLFINLAHGEIAAVVDEAEIIGVEIFPAPIKTGQLAEIRVFRGDVVAGIVGGEVGDFFVKGGADLERDVEVVGRGGVGLVDGDEEGNGFC